jgi:hypothetical protein
LSLSAAGSLIESFKKSIMGMQKGQKLWEEGK